jgi:hypothetical protein
MQPADLAASMPRKDKIRYLTSRPGAEGELLRHFWQPSAKLVAQGWQLQRVPLDWASYTDPDALYAAAAGRAIELNRHLDQTRDAKALTAARPPEPVKRTVANLIKAYRLDKAFLDLAPKTRRDYDQCLDRIIAWAGDELIAAIDGASIEDFRAGMSRTPSQCNAVIRVLRLVLNWGMDAKNKMPGGGRWTTENAAARPGLTPAAVSGRIWPRMAVQLFVDKADALDMFGMGTAIVLDEWLGQREADILRMPRTILREGRLIFRQAKGTSVRRGTQGAGVVLPVDRVPVLKSRLAAQLARNKAAHKALEDKGLDKLIPLNIIQTEEGAAYKADWFRHAFAKVRAGVEADMLKAAGWTQDKAGAWTNADVERRLHNLLKKEREAEREKARRRAASFEIDYLLPGRDMEDGDAFRLYIGELQFMHLRHTAITRLAEAGCGPELIASISGHSLKTVHQILERYMVRTAEMAETAFTMRMAKEAGDQAQKDTAEG